MNIVNKTPLQYKADRLTYDGILLDKIFTNKKTPFYLNSKKTLNYYYNYFAELIKVQYLDRV
jgi:hypothetical protein